MDLSEASLTVPADFIFGAVLVPSLRYYRLSRALSQDTLAERAGVSPKTVIRGEKGLEIRLSSVRALASALRVSPRRLQQPIPPASSH